MAKQAHTGNGLYGWVRFPARLLPVRPRCPQHPWLRNATPCRGLQPLKLAGTVYAPRSLDIPNSAAKGPMASGSDGIAELAALHCSGDFNTIAVWALVISRPGLD